VTALGNTGSQIPFAAPTLNPMTVRVIELKNILVWQRNSGMEIRNSKMKGCAD
jgi:hypothetical protein